MTINVIEIDDIAVIQDAENTIVDLSDNFDDPRTTGLVARFELEDESLAGGIANVVLFDQADEGAPNTVQNFQNYVDRQDYDNSIIHRSVPNFVVQGGGFTVENAQVDVIPTDPPIDNEFSPERSNLRGTIATAKLGGDPDSATSQWFFNLADNSQILDTQNGGFTVFGAVLGDADLAVIDAIASLPIQNFSGANPAFGELPIRGEIGDPPAEDLGLVRFETISVSQEDELSFDLLSNSNPDLVEASVADGQLVLDYLEGQSGTAELVIEATNLLGETTQDTLAVTVDPETEPEEPEPTEPEPTEPDPVVPVPSSPLQLGSEDNDVLIGAATDDKLVGFTGDDRLVGADRQDILRGNQGRDSLHGGSNNDFLSGGGDNDLLNGGLGHDTLDGGRGSNQLFGGQGRDVFVIGQGDRDYIRDFTDGEDRLQLVGSSFNQLTIRQVNDNTLIQDGQTSLAVLKGVDSQFITSEDFLA